MSPPMETSVASADRLSRQRFTYRQDPAGTDTWTSHADDVIAGRRWEGDCDDLASTTLDLLVRQNPDYDQGKLYRCCVKSPACPAGVEYDHMVAAAMIRAGVLVIFGDTQGPPTAYVNSPHRIMRYATLSEGVTWRAGHP